MPDTDLTGFLKNKENIIPLFPDANITDILAVGGQGIVYRGRIKEVDAAIKIYFPGQMQVRVEREIRALSEFDNPNIVKLLWSGEVGVRDQTLPAVATQLIAGSNLRDRLADHSMSDEEIGLLIYDIASAIASMWEKRIVHRDLTPANILIRPDGHACVIDLGVARHIYQTPLTATGFTWGTYGYMSPEQTRASKQLTCKSDVYTLGILAVECALGRHPTGGDQLRLVSLGLHEQLPRELASWVYSSLVKAMLNPRPVYRPKPEAVMAELKSGQGN